MIKDIFKAAVFLLTSSLPVNAENVESLAEGISLTEGGPLFIGDTNHACPLVWQQLYSSSTVTALQDAGYKRLLVEITATDYMSGLFDELNNGQLSYDDFIKDYMAWYLMNDFPNHLGQTRKEVFEKQLEQSEFYWQLALAGIDVIAVDSAFNIDDAFHEGGYDISPEELSWFWEMLSQINSGIRSEVGFCSDFGFTREEINNIELRAVADYLNLPLGVTEEDIKENAEYRKIVDMMTIFFDGRTNDTRLIDEIEKFLDEDTAIIYGNGHIELANEIWDRGGHIITVNEGRVTAEINNYSDAYDDIHDGLGYISPP